MYIYIYIYIFKSNHGFKCKFVLRKELTLHMIAR